MCSCGEDCAECPIGLASEEDLNYPYQLHITVEFRIEPDDLMEPWYRFKEACENLGMKPLWIRNHMFEHKSIHEFITVRNVNTSQIEAVNTLDVDGQNLSAAGFNVIRSKIETVPWHPDATNPSKDQYFETHIKLNGDAPISAWEQLTDIQEDQKLYHSQSLQSEYVTFREYGVSYESYKRDLNWAIHKVRECGFTLSDKIISEFALYDSNVHLDDRWMKRGEFAKI